jgi:hypothetical protein
VILLLAALALQPAPVQITLTEETIPLTVVALARGTRQPLVGASVTLDGQAAGETDEQGRVSVRVRPGRHVVQIQHPGQEVIARPLEIPTGAPPLTLTLRLEPAGSALAYETVVRAPLDAPAVSLDRQEITKTPGSFGDPFRVIESLPGVTPIVWPLAVYSVRGANPGNTGFLVDGLRVPALFHFALGPAVIHPYFLGGLDFYAGGYPARYGRYVAGLVSASTAAPPTDRAHGSADLRLFDAGGILTTPIDGGRGSLAVAGRYGYPGALITLLQQDVQLQYWDYQGRFDHTLGPGRFSLFAFGSYDSLATQPPTPNDEPSRSERLALYFHRLDARWTGSAGRGRLTARLALGVDATETPGDGDDRFSTSTRRMMPRLSYERSFGRAVWEIGADGELADHRPQVMVETAPGELAAFARPRTASMAGAWTQLALRFGERVLLTPGVRVDVYEEGGTRAADVGPRLDLRVRASEAVWLKASGGRFTQMPTFPLEIPGFEGFGLADLGLQSSWQGALGVEAALPRAFHLDATTFLHRYVLTDIRDPEIGNPLLNDFLTRRDALSYGVELMVRRPPGARTYGWIAYTLSRSLRAFEGGVVSDADWDQRHVINVVAGHRFRRTTIGARFHLHSGRPVTVENSRPLEFARLPPFYQLDLRVERRFLFDKFTLDVYLETVNTTATSQVVALRRTRTGIAHEAFSLVLPSLGVRGEF